MANHYNPYIPVILTIIITLCLGIVILFFNAIIGPKRKTTTKGMPFECGMDPVGEPRKRFSVKFYLVAIFFIVFDIETVFLFPWAVIFRELLSENFVAFFEGVIFIGVLAVALLYVWKKGALEWE